jgi:hypothetical protein
VSDIACPHEGCKGKLECKDKTNLIFVCGSCKCKFRIVLLKFDGKCYHRIHKNEKKEN